jgi:hypothetical protein
MKYVSIETGEIVNLVQYRNNQYRASRRSYTFRQIRRDAHFPKAMRALGLLGLLGVILCVWAQVVK